MCFFAFLFSTRFISIVIIFSPFFLLIVGSWVTIKMHQPQSPIQKKFTNNDFLFLLFSHIITTHIHTICVLLAFLWNRCHCCFCFSFAAKKFLYFGMVCSTVANTHTLSSLSFYLRNIFFYC